ncbi:MAG: hypothetical protein AAF492_13580, partial [Verrucomicrobiota bacterium]
MKNRQERIVCTAILMAVFSSGLCMPGRSQVVIHQESFEAPPSGANYSVIGEYWDGNNDYFTRADNTFGNYPTHPSNPDGTFYYVGRDILSNGSVPPQPPGGTATISIVSVDVSSFQNLEIRLAIQDANGDFEAVAEGSGGDFVRILAVADGVTSMVGQVTGSFPNDDAVHDDIDLDGFGDPAATSTTADFTDFSFSVPGSPSALEVLIEVRTDFDSERLAIDNLRILGDAAVMVIANSNATAIASSSATLNAGFVGTGDVYDVAVYWGPTDGGANASLWSNVAVVGTFTNQPPTSLSHPVAGLPPNSSVFFAWRATNGSETIWAQPSLAFNTPGPPSMDNDGGALVGVGQADLRGTLLDGDAADVTLYWGTTDGGTSMSAWDAGLSLGSQAEGAVQAPVSNLLYGVRYFYRAYATNLQGEAWANATTNFLTLPPAGVGMNPLP